MKPKERAFSGALIGEKKKDGRRKGKIRKNLTIGSLDCVKNDRGPTHEEAKKKGGTPFTCVLITDQAVDWNRNKPRA